MTFDPHSLERLRELGRQLPQPLPKSSPPPKQKLHANKKAHRIETEENPQALFQELIKASPDGNVPIHLINRLKELEAKQLEEENITETNLQTSLTTNKIQSPRRRPPRKNSEEEVLYATFNRFLFEDEE